jgi:hypothetical protein
MQKKTCDEANFNKITENLQQIKQLSDELELRKSEIANVAALTSSLNQSSETILELQQKCTSLESNLAAIILERDDLTRQCTEFGGTISANNSKRSKLEKEFRDFQLMIQDKDR